MTTGGAANHTFQFNLVLVANSQARDPSENHILRSKKNSPLSQWDNELLSSSLTCFIYSISGLRGLQATNKRPAEDGVPFSLSLPIFVSISLAPSFSAIFDTDVLINAPH